MKVALTHLVLWSLVLAPAAAGPATAEVPVPKGAEMLRYRWRLEGLQGFLAWLMRRVPTSGEGVMTSIPQSRGRVVHEFRATSPKAAADEYWSYRSELDLSGPRTLRVVDSIKYRDKERRKVYELEDLDALDLLSGLHVLRRSMPEEEQTTVIWSDRKLYEVRLIPGGLVARRIEGEQKILRHFTLRPVKRRGVRDWNARAEVWFSHEVSAAPVEILYRRTLGQVRLVLQD